MSHIECPHCRSEVPNGAKVCRGCQAEIEYGAPPFLYLILLAGAGWCGYKSYDFFYSGLSFLSWVLAGGVFLLGSVALAKLFENRVHFSREYKTK